MNRERNETERDPKQCGVLTGKPDELCFKWAQLRQASPAIYDSRHATIAFVTIPVQTYSRLENL